jgi:hypothetical protein
MKGEEDVFMTRVSRTVQVGMLVGSMVVARVAGADVKGSFDGALASAKLAQPMQVAAVLSQAGRSITGTVALPGDPALFGGAYLVHGTATPKRIKIAGVAGPVTFKWRAKIVGSTLQGPARVKRPGQKPVAGTLVMTLNASATDGSGCDGVFNANQTFFVDQVLGQAMTSCGSCHAPGLQADATRLHVTPSDPLSTARAVALQVDFTNASASRILEKPLAVLPHGGGAQITAGSSQEQILSQWVALLVQAQCN